ncbi:MAG TPA: TlpA family protein disulfide reductase [Spirochaetes bacterium]|nr:TlpA family protein disulfide reductase [Spirochaetota bacterium]
MDIKRSFRKLGILVPKTKKQANNFTLKNLEGQKVSLKDFRGKVVFLNFWATWCGSCRAEMPSMQKLYQTLKDKDFVMLGVAVDQTQDPVEPYVELLEMTFPVVYDSDKEVSSRYRLSATPTTYIIDKDGTILGKVVGESDWASKTSIDLFNKLSSR